MISFFESLSVETLDWLVDISTEQTISEGTVLIEEGTDIGFIYLVMEGLLGVYAETPENDDIEVGRQGPGAVIGEMSFINDGKTSASVKALQRTIVLSVGREKILEKINSDTVFASEFYRSIAKVLSDKLQATTRGAVQTPSTIESFSGNSVWSQVERDVSECKTLLENADKEIIKNGKLSSESFLLLAKTFKEIEIKSGEILGDESPVNSHLKEQIGIKLRHEFLPYMLMTGNGERCYSKPRGYAGDFYSIELIYRNEAFGTGRLGPVIDRLFLDLDAAQAVRNRRGLLVEEINKTLDKKSPEPANVMALACGPARELWDIYMSMENPEKLKSTLLDIDQQALDFVADWRAENKLESQISLLNQNLILLSLGRKKIDIEPQDLIYSIGLIDYFDDKIVIKLINFIFEKLAVGGRIILGNFHPKNMSKPFMDYVLDWRLIHRNENDMNRLFENSAFNRPATNIRFEQCGINLFAECIKSKQ